MSTDPLLSWVIPTASMECACVLVDTELNTAETVTFNPQLNSRVLAPFLCLVYKSEHYRKLSKLPRVAQLTTGRMGTGTRAIAPENPHSRLPSSLLV